MTLVIFDCDGVLVDTEPVANAIFAQSIRDLGLSMTDKEALDRFTGLSMARCVTLIEEQLEGALPDGWLDRMQAATFRAFREQGVMPVRGVKAVIESLNREGQSYCVASSGEHEKMELTLGLSGLLPLMNGARFSATEVPNGKPHPDLFLHAARAMGCAPSRAVVIEDSLPGVQAAVRAKMTVFGYAERTAPEVLDAEGATVFAEMSLLPALLSSWLKESA